MAHDAVEVLGSVRVLEQVEIRRERALRHERAAEALDRHVGQCEETVEADAELIGELAFVVGLERLLRRRQHRALRVVDEIEHQRRIARIAERVERLQRRDALVEHAVAALPVDVGQRVAGQRRDDLDLLVAQEFRQTFLPRLEQDRQVAAIDHAYVERARGCHEPSEVRVQFRGAAGQVERGHRASFEHVDHEVDRVAIHDLGAVRAGVDVAVQAGLVAAVAEVHLQRVERATLQRGEVGPDEQRQGGVHVKGAGKNGDADLSSGCAPALQASARGRQRDRAGRMMRAARNSTRRAAGKGSGKRTATVKIRPAGTNRFDRR